MRVIALVMVACGAKAVEPVAPVAPQETPTQRAREIDGPRFRLTVSVPRPEIDVAGMRPDFHEDLRWPLSIATHPVLEPRFPIARELAQPGIGWVDLCSRGITNRHVIGANALDMLDYLRAWCAAANHDVDTALGKLAALRGTAVFGIPAAIKLDVPFIVCELPAKEAERTLAKYQLDNVDILDNLAATYVELGRDDDARVINKRAIEYATQQSDASLCRRATRAILLSDRDVAPKQVVELKRWKATEARADATCVKLVHALECWLERDSCDGYLADAGYDLRERHVLWAYTHWPLDKTGWAGWIQIPQKLVLAPPGERADLLGVAAIEAAVRVSRCEPSNLAAVRDYADYFRSFATVDRTDKLAHITRDECIALATE
jgi:hypothetical protein